MYSPLHRLVFLKRQLPRDDGDGSCADLRRERS